MKKLILFSLLVMMSISAAAQMHIGGNININIDNEKTTRDSGFSKSKENEFTIKLAPKIYWNLNERFRAGLRVGFSYGQYKGSVSYDESDIISGLLGIPDSTPIDRAIGWGVSPFCGYQVLTLGRFTAWVEANVCVDQQFNITDIVFPELEWKNVLGYGFQILPVVDFHLNETLALQIHFGIISIGWYGSRYNYENKHVTTSHWDIRKGGFDGLLQGFMDYGFGIVRSF